MRTFAVRAQNGVVCFSPVRALIGTGVTEAWPMPARVALRLVAPDDPACVADGERAEGSRAGPGGPSHSAWAVRALGAVGRAWIDQVGPCRIDVIDVELLDDGSRLFFSALADVSGGRVTIRCRARSSDGPAPLAPRASARERRIEDLASSSGRLDGEEVDFLYRQALGYLRDGDGWTAERLLRAVLPRRPTPAVRRGLLAAGELLGRPPGAGPDPGDRARGGAGGGGPDLGRPGPARPGPSRPAPDGQAPVRPEPDRPAGRTGDRRGGALRLGAGWERLERWSETAGQIERNAVHKALFAVADRSVFRSYETYDDAVEPLDLFVRVREGLVLKVRIRDLDTFDIAHVGPVGEAPGLDAETGRLA
ncbi:DUF6235 family protein [Streptomyces sp. NPDC048606]|uniref:DUF6235 family protein n=1 Tax=Streptomyces sp. NPDC048606 TaxID=3154726 RepID=UPI0034378DE0